MSVMTFEAKEFQRVAASIIETPAIKKFVIDKLTGLKFFNDYIDNQVKMRFPGEPERDVTEIHSVFIWKMLKMAYVGNLTTYGFQYKETVDFGGLKTYDEADTEDFDYLLAEEITGQIGGFIYNVYANNGEILMAPGYFEALEILYTAFKETHPEPQVEISSYWID